MTAAGDSRPPRVAGGAQAGGAPPGGSRRKRARPRGEAAPTGAPAPGAAPQGAAPVPSAAWPAFWLPAPLRARLITPHTRWQEVRFARGRRCADDCPEDATGAVTARRPLFDDAEWAEVMRELRAARERAPRGPEYWARLQAALGVVARRLADPADRYHQALLETLPGYTGYSRGMVAAAFAGPDAWDVEQMVAALRFQPDKVCSERWHTIPGLRGRLRFFAGKPFDKAAGWIPVAWEMPLYRTEARPGMVLGYAGANVPGDALRMLVLALATTLRGEAPLPRPGPPPAVLLCHSPDEPLLTPLVLSALEEVDAALVSMVAAMMWDHGDEGLADRLLGEADLVVASAGGDELAGLSHRVRSRPHKPRLHAHGNTVSFTVISRETLESQSVIDDQSWSPPGGTEIIDIVALLAGLDSAFWDQNSRLSSRVHFVERGGPADDLPAEYARRLTVRLRQIDEVMPRGAWPTHLLHDQFDRYKALEGSDRWGTGLQVVSEYDDPFVVVLDGRSGKETPLHSGGLASVVEECRTRAIVVRPVDDIMEVPWGYLDMLPRHSVQSLGVALGRPGQGLSKQVREFAAACGKRGVSTIRTVGRAALPQPAYSWDGLLPLDFLGRRPAGHFTTIEFDAPFDEMLETYRAGVLRLAQIR